MIFLSVITTDQEVYDFSDVFAKLIANQLFPSSKVFDVRDFVFFNDIGIKLSEMSEDDIEEALIHIKSHVLRGKVYSHTDFDKVAYEVKRLFAGRAEKDDAIRKQLDRIEAMEKKHRDELSAKDDVINKYKEEKEAAEKVRLAKKAKRNWFMKLISFGITVMSSLFILLYLTHIFADGKNLFQKVVNFWVYYGAWGIGIAFYFRWAKMKSS